MPDLSAKAKIHLAWAALVVTPFAVWLLALWQTTLAPGQCSGIGWGCSLAGTDAVGVAIIVFGPFVLAFLVLGHGVIGFVLRRRERASGSDRP